MGDMKFTARVSASIHYSTWRWCSFLWNSKLLDKEPVNNFQLAAPTGTVHNGHHSSQTEKKRNLNTNALEVLSYCAFIKKKLWRRIFFHQFFLLTSLDRGDRRVHSIPKAQVKMAQFEERKKIRRYTCCAVSVVTPQIRSIQFFKHQTTNFN